MKKQLIVLAILSLLSCRNNNENTKKNQESQLIDTLGSKKEINSIIVDENSSQEENLDGSENKIDKLFLGKYGVGVETDGINGGTAVINYEFEIFEEYVLLRLETIHEPVICEGMYDFKMKEGVLQLFYAGSDEPCERIKPMFEIKLEKNKLFVRGLGGEGTIKSWIEIYPSM